MMAAKQAIFTVSPLSAQVIKDEFRPPKTNFSGFRSRFSRSQSPAHPGKPVTTTLERPKTSNGPGRRIDEFRGRDRDTTAKDDLLIRNSEHTTQHLGTLPCNFPVSALQTPTKAREITITPRKTRTSSASQSPVPSLYRSRDTTPLGFKEHRAKLADSRESSRQRNNTSGYDQQLPLRDLAKNNQVQERTYMAGSQLQPEQLPIGMALGSPSQAPPNFQSMVQQPVRSETMPAPRKSTSGQRPPRSESIPPPQIPPQPANPTTNIISAEKPVKVSKWKRFGRFGKKSAQELAQDVEKFENAAAQNEDPIRLEVSKGKVERSRTLKEKKSTRALKKERPGLSRVTTAPTGAGESYVKEKSAEPLRVVGAFEESMDDILAREQLKSNRAHSELKPDTSSKGLLAVDIPSIQMERYSVMFEELLGSSTPTKKISTSNLLARRQATLDRLKTVNESIAELELEEARLGVKLAQKTRRMTSPAASPSLTLFPGHNHLTPSAAAASNNAITQRLHRSNTSPAMLSPNRMTFPQHTRVEAENKWTERNLVASPTSTVSDDAGPPTPDKHAKVVSVSVKQPAYVPPEPAWEMLESSTTKTRQRSNTTRPRDNGLQSARAMAQRVRANTASSRQTPLPSPRASNSSSASNSGSLQSTASANSSATTISSSSLNQRLIPKIKIRHKPALEPYPSGIVPGIPGGAPVATSTSSFNVSSSGSSIPRESPVVQHPERGSSRQVPQPVPSPHLHSQDDLVHGMKIPVSRFSTAPARRLPAELPKPEMGEDEVVEEDQELQIRTAADVSIARQISISRQQSQMLKQRLARGERRRREGKGIDEREHEREARLGRRHEKEKEIRMAIDEKGGLLRSEQRGRGLMPMVVSGEENRKSEYVVFESE